MDNEKSALAYLKSLTPSSIRTRIEAVHDPIVLAKVDEEPQAKLNIDSSGFSASERKLVVAAESVLQDIGKKLGDVFNAENKFRLNLNIEDNWRKLTSIHEQCSDQIDTEIKSRSEHLETDIKHLELVKYTHRRFKDENGLNNRAASYSKTETYHYSIIIGLVVLEAFLNSNYLAGGSRFGLLGGTLQSVSFSILNLLLALLIGKRAQYLVHVKKHLRIMGGCAAALFFFLILAVNLVIGHYADAITNISDPFAAAATAFSSFMQGYFALESLPAIAICSTGVLFSLLYLYEFLKIDDVYPGYKKVDVDLVQAREKAISARENQIKEISRIGDSNLSELGTLSRTIRSSVSEFKQSIESVERLYESSSDITNMTLNALKTTIQNYRGRVIQFNPQTDTLLIAPLDRLQLQLTELNPQTDLDKEKLPHFEQQEKSLQELSIDEDKRIRQITREKREEFTKAFAYRTSKLDIDEH